MREEIDINGKWLGISTKVVPEKLGFGLNTIKKFWTRETGNKFGSYDFLTLRTKSTYDEKDNKIIMWEITSSYFSDKIYLKDSSTLSFILDRNNTHIIDDMFYFRSLKNGEEEKEIKEPKPKKASVGYGSFGIDINSFYSTTIPRSRYSISSIQSSSRITREATITSVGGEIPVNNNQDSTTDNGQYRSGTSIFNSSRYEVELPNFFMDELITEPEIELISPNLLIKTLCKDTDN